MNQLLTKQSLSILLFLVIPLNHLFSQTIDVYPKNNFSVNDTLKISVTINSLLDSYSLDEIFNSEMKMVLEIKSIGVIKILPNVEYVTSQLVDVKDRVLNLRGNLNLELTQTENENVFVYNSHKTLSEFVGLEDDEYLNHIELDWNDSDWWMYWKISNDIVFEQLNTNSNSISFSGGSDFLIIPNDKLTKVKEDEIIISNHIKNNLSFLIEENTEDLLLEKDSSGETIFSQSIGLRDPIIGDFNNDGINDIVSQIYQYYVGDHVTTILTDEEKEKLISRWGVFLGTESEGDSLVYEMGFRYDEKSEGGDFSSIDLNNDGFLDILSNPSSFHGLIENRPDYYEDLNHRPRMVYINDGNGNFSLDSLTNSLLHVNNIQLDNDKDYELISSYHPSPFGKMTIKSWDYIDEEFTFIGEYSTDYDYVLDFDNYDLNRDGFQDVIILTYNSYEKIRTYTYSVHYGSTNGVNLNKEFSEIIYEFDEPIQVDVEGNPFTIIKFNEDTDLVVMWLLNQYWNHDLEYEGEFQTKLKVFEISEETLIEVTEDILPDGLDLNYVNLGSPPLFKDLNSDGLIDLYFQRNTWYKGFDPIGISCFINNGTYFEPKYFSSFEVHSGDYSFLDIDNDNISEIVFGNRYIIFLTYTNLNTKLIDYPFEVIYQNESPSDINLSNTSIIENSEGKTVIGTLSSVDLDNTDSHFYYLVPGNGDSGNQYFTIEDNKLLSNVIFDYESQDSYQVRIQTEDGKGGMYSKLFTISVSDVDEDMDGDGVMDSVDICPDTPNGTTVDSSGCFTLPSNNFTIEVISETCPTKNNGKIVISTIESHNYETIINETKYNFTDSLLVENLTPDSYTFCIMVDGENYTQCYTVEIDEGTRIEGKSSVTSNKLSVEISEGTYPYTILKNGREQFKTNSSSFSLEITNGDLIEVKTSVECEGVFSKTIELSDNILVYPNPTNGEFEISLPVSQGEVDIKLYTVDSKLISVKTYPISFGRVQLNLRDKPSGIYVVKVLLDNPISLKIIKE